MDSRTLRALSRAIREARDEVPLNQTWKRIHHSMEVGRPVGKRLFLSPRERQMLREILVKEEGHDPFENALPSSQSVSRTEMAAVTNNEKVSRRRVKEDLVLIRGLSARVPGMECLELAAGGHVGVPWQSVSPHMRDSVLVVENFETFSRIGDCRLPDSLVKRDPLVVYRGDVQATPAAVVSLLRAWSGDVIGFGDFDPAGVLYASGLPSVNRIVMPDIPVDELERMSIKGRFYDQHDQWLSLKNRYQEHWFPRLLWEMGSRRLAVPQEAMMANGARLDLQEVCSGKLSSAQSPDA